MAKKKIFISHVSEETDLAVAVKERLVNDFLGLVDVFMSSDTESISGGAMWLKSIEAALKSSKVLVVLCSRLSIQRPWISFETGFAWGRGIPIFPLCHGGLEPHDLPIPLRLLQGGKAGDMAGAKLLYKRVADTLACEVPKGGVKDFVAAVIASEKRGELISTSPLPTSSSPTVPEPPRNEKLELVAKHVLNYLRANDFEMVSFERVRDRIDETYSDSVLLQLIDYMPDRFRRARVKGGLQGLAVVS